MSSPFSQSKPAHLLVGEEGEDIAIHYLRGLGYAVLGRDVSMGREEIDIIAFDPRDGVIVFVEVKTRSKHYDDFSPLLAATYRKRANVMRAAKRWMAWRKEARGFRLDLISVEDGEVTEHLEEVPFKKEKGYGY
ncbi:MAG: YraN family protein [Candidatus Peribacteraceae bacterium]